MSVNKSIVNALDYVIKPLIDLWGPYRPHKFHQHTNIFNFCPILAAKFLGRTVTLGVGAGISALALNALASTKIGLAIGLNQLTATISAWPLAFTVTAIALPILFTSLLCSYLIQEFV